jgi:hypothetical protein
MDGFDGPSALMHAMIQSLENVERPFYEEAAASHYRAWHVTMVLGIMISVAAAIVAELIDGPQFDHWGKAVLTVLPLLATGLTALVSHFRFHEKEALREQGRIEVEDIIRNAKMLAANATTEEQMVSAYHAVRQRAYDLEMKQHTNDVAIRSPDRDNDRN